MFKKEVKTPLINDIYAQVKEFYAAKITENRKKYLEDTITEYGYLNIPYLQALKELSPAEIFYGLEIKWENEGVFKNGSFEYDKISALARNKVKNTDWFKKEGHNIKLINLAGLGDGNETTETGKFIDWLRQLLILPTGRRPQQENCPEIFNTTIYLIPFQRRDFGCAYLPKSSEVSKKLLDKNLETATGLDVKEQVKLFINLAQLGGHPVIYDVLPQTGRFSKAVLSAPSIARWYDIPELTRLYRNELDEVAKKLYLEYDCEDVDLVKDIYVQSTEGDLSPHFQEIFDKLEAEMCDVRKKYSNEMLKKISQEKLVKRVREVVRRLNETAPKTEDDIINQVDIIQALIGEGLWTAPGGAWCSAGVPVYDKMSQCGSYPVFKHYDHKGEDVTHFANLDCQTPYYFAFLEDGSLNKPVVNYFVDYLKNIQQEYNFDGYRIDHIDHIVDEISEQNGKPISYRAPRAVLAQLSKTLHSQVPYFALLAEYMLWDDLLKEYHQDMGFDALWGNDIVAQFEKTPEQIVEDNQHLAAYNTGAKNLLSILKTYNNQDGEFRSIDQYPGQLSEQGALYKWFKYKTLPGGKFAQRPMMYIDGDESFTQRGIEHVIGEEVSMKRDDNREFYAKFDALDRFVKSQEIITDGEAQIIVCEDDGFCAWLVTKEPAKTAFLMVSNYKYPTEKIENEIVAGEPVYDKSIQLPCDYVVKNEYVFDGKDYTAEEAELPDKFEQFDAGDFRIYELSRIL